jgi:FHA domain
MDTEIICEVCRSICKIEDETCPNCGNALSHHKNLKTVGIADINPDKLRFNAGSARFGYQFILRFHLENIPDTVITVKFNKHLVLGRMAGEDQDYIDFSLYNGHEHGISRMHARIIRHPMALLLQDLGSTNGTFLNGVRLEDDKGALLRDKDIITLGRMTIRVEFISDFEAEK